MEKPYKYKKPPPNQTRILVNRPAPWAADEQLTGWVHGVKASPEEERYARALRKHRLDFDFQVEFPASAGFSGKVEFVVSEKQPVIIYEEAVYMTSEQRGQNKLREMVLTQMLRQKGMRNLQTVWYYTLQTQEQADTIVKENMGWQ
ncbi:MAG: hypothetical protein OEZ02_15080 [Anaerolineae bacterium]|nr:hypothetical protein [Anaerolineae bacterium]